MSSACMKYEVQRRLWRIGARGGEKGREGAGLVSRMLLCSVPDARVGLRIFYGKAPQKHAM
eukprot:365619-Chlamydomonas_euryale.AAC.8